MGKNKDKDKDKKKKKDKDREKERSKKEKDFNKEKSRHKSDRKPSVDEPEDGHYHGRRASSPTSTMIHLCHSTLVLVF